MKCSLLVVLCSVLFVLFGQSSSNPAFWSYSTQDNEVFQLGTDFRISLRSIFHVPINKFAIALNAPIPLLFVEDAIGELYRIYMKPPFQAVPIVANFSSWSLSEDQTHLYFTTAQSISRCALNGLRCQSLSCPSGDSNNTFVAFVEANTTTAYAVIEQKLNGSGTLWFYRVNLTSPSFACTTVALHRIDEGNSHQIQSRFVIRNSTLLRSVETENWLLTITALTSDIGVYKDSPWIICTGGECTPDMVFYLSALKSFGIIRWDAFSLISSNSNGTFSLTNTLLRPSDVGLYGQFPFFETPTSFPPGAGCPNYCSLNGLCTNGACQCGRHYYQSDCSVYCTDDTTCSGHGTCNSTTGACDCNPLFSGKSCGTYTPVIPPVFPPNFSANATVVIGGVNVKTFSLLNYSSDLQFLQVSTPNGNTTLNLYEFGVQYNYNNSSCTVSTLSQPSLPTIISPGNITLRGVPCGNDQCNVFGTKATLQVWFVISTKKPYMVVGPEITLMFQPESFTPMNFSSVPSAPSWCNGFRRVSISIN